jgi:hypothetical protein
MKKIRSTPHPMCVTVILFCLFSGVTIGEARENAINDILFQPPDPAPGSDLRLRIAVSPASQNPGKTVTIFLTTWTDKNGDCQYTTGEDVEHPKILVKDNGVGDEETLMKNEIIVKIFSVPKESPPQEYRVYVKFGGAVKAESIFVPSDQIGGGPFKPILAKLCQIEYKISKRFKTAQSEMRHRSPEELKASNTLYVYDLNEKTRQKIAHSDTDSYLTPTWSFDSRKIALVLKQGAASKIAWLELERKELISISEGPDDTSPFWLPDNRHLLFVRSGGLWLVDTEAVKPKPVAVTVANHRIEALLGVLVDKDSRAYLLYEGHKTDAETTAIYMVELDAQFRPTATVHHLVYNPIWHLLPASSPSRETLVYSEKDTASGRYRLFTSPLSEVKPQPLFAADEYNDYDPVWSPDGGQIVFVSNRP